MGLLLILRYAITIITTRDIMKAMTYEVELKNFCDQKKILTKPTQFSDCLKQNRPQGSQLYLGMTNM